LMPSCVAPVQLSSPITKPKFWNANHNTMYLNCHSFHSLRYGTIPLMNSYSRLLPVMLRQWH
jgi:hypothetical protein